MQEANQEVPDWLTRYASRASFGGGKKRIIYCCWCLEYCKAGGV
uniref:Uncharacterized protein n=1 Tax=Brassica oleracea TaxID=3712 RepID=A0A3P6DVT0_BRAOL|nr:unnamed protein product [Brassica oleracea]